MLALARERDRQDLAAGPLAQHVDRRVFHRQPAAEVAVDPFHQGVFIGDGPLGDQVVNVIGPVLNGRVPAATVFLDDDLDHGRVQALRRVHGGRAALDVMDLRPLLDDDQRALELAHVLGVDPEIGLQRHINLDPGRNVHERAAAPDRRVQGRELVVLDRDDRREILLDQIGVFAHRGVGVDEDHALLLQVFTEAVIDHFRFVLGAHAGQELAFGFRNAQLIERILDLGRHVVPGLSLAVGRLHVIVNIIEIEFRQVAPPDGRGL